MKVTIASSIRVGLVCAAVVLIAMSGSCSLYSHANREKSADPRVVTVIEKDSSKYHLRYVEADDRGWFWHPEQADNVLSSIKRESEADNIIVVLFVHGWHHSSECYDENLEAFKNVLARLDTELETYTVTRLATSNSVDSRPSRDGAKVPKLRIFGIFVSWRGRSLPSYLDYATFWGRKTAAETFGTRDLREFMHRLQMLYDEQNARQSPKPFFGLVSIGHSFGGAALLKATSFEFERQLELVNARSGFLRKGIEGVPAVPIRSPVAGFGDLVVLVNPAIEASAYERINQLSRGLSFPDEQSPLLVTFSAENDWVRQHLFKPGRIAGELFTTSAHVPDPTERSLERNPLGVYDETQVGATHELRPAGDRTVNIKQVQMTRDPLCTASHIGESRSPDSDLASGYYEWLQWEEPTGPDSVIPGETFGLPNDKNPLAQRDLEGEIAKFDFSGNVQFVGVRQTRKEGREPAPGRSAAKHQPFMIVDVDDTIINGHNGIFSEPFMNFLMRYVGLAEAKRYLNMARRPVPPTQADSIEHLVGGVHK
ncbi:alpha/beta fold hydrolase [Caballeronia sp. LZ008]|uniref:alpha/beta fold hydrolase n=1 Tax=unclassified Caballeronia TaxID=2646786 RepID=UPI0020298240|nr:MULTISPECIES: alpha/beta fold hydrolase [unclassified Caballeronia]MDR5798225.1 alpha/beta fold hydrolase [Caballeronia sp. LZ008]